MPDTPCPIIKRQRSQCHPYSKCYPHSKVENVTVALSAISPDGNQKERFISLRIVEKCKLKEYSRASNKEKSRQKIKAKEGDRDMWGDVSDIPLAAQNKKK